MNVRNHKAYLKPEIYGTISGEPFKSSTGALKDGGMDWGKKDEKKDGKGVAVEKKDEKKGSQKEEPKKEAKKAVEDKKVESKKDQDEKEKVEKEKPASKVSSASG